MAIKAKPSERVVGVWADCLGLAGPKLMGDLKIRQVRGTEIFSFEYDDEWLNNAASIPLDPDLQLYRGEIFPSQGQNQFGVFLDSAPDRWGRMLMRRRESIRARKEQRVERQLYESDFLLGLHDETRLGGLRFRDRVSGTFLDPSERDGVPPWTSLRELEEACRRLEDDPEESSEYREALQMILTPGSSLGGARPKASVADTESKLWIAKFPSREDTLDSGAWEMVVHILAKECNIDVPEAKIQKLARPQHTFMVRRFDRDLKTKQRIHFVSAMTLLQRKDGDDSRVGASYLEIAELIQSQGSHPVRDLEELWKRIVFSMLVSNCDDHLRNHGFLLDSQGWKLSPAYDINPDPNGDGLKLNVSENDHSQDLELAISVAPFFRVGREKAEQIVSAMKKTVRSWDDKAAKLKISPSERRRAARAFRLAGD
jgi:serine/threonine-protein kinase HipA